MRDKLSKQEDIRSSFSGTFKRFGTKTNYHGYPEKTVLLINIRDENNKFICDHLWFNYTKQFQNLEDIEENDVVKFDARVKMYEKGHYDNRTYDYKLSYPTKVSFIKHEKRIILYENT